MISHYSPEYSETIIKTTPAKITIEMSIEEATILWKGIGRTSQLDREKIMNPEVAVKLAHLYKALSSKLK